VARPTGRTENDAESTAQTVTRSSVRSQRLRWRLDSRAVSR